MPFIKLTALSSLFEKSCFNFNALLYDSSLVELPNVLWANILKYADVPAFINSDIDDVNRYFASINDTKSCESTLGWKITTGLLSGATAISLIFALYVSFKCYLANKDVIRYQKLATI